MDAIKNIATFLAAAYIVFGLLNMLRSAFADRTGNSGQYGHFDDNRRIDGPDGA